MLRAGPGYTDVDTSSSSDAGFESICEPCSLLMLSPQDCKPKVSEVSSLPVSPPPWVFLRVRSGPVCLSHSRSSTRFEVRGALPTWWVSGGSHRDTAMPKRLSAHLSNIPVAGSDPFESIESRRRRLFPQSEQPAPPQLPGSSPPASAGRLPTPAAASHTVERMPNRADAPVLHPTRKRLQIKGCCGHS